ncbi:MAG: UDP-N-acetylmuramoyl-L-alanine--D-glutamate ligase [Caldilineaceae bacterium]|nr:UDP-N-acetylmuramoyl-L-alanine--D-glutamate ligase [Caldilineaceae bacterium]HRJ43873.1 UDP-N-acetylmuramoyl-L-alanine--D-glutamate ligase [Caldilineaceae bacterium]
MFNFHNRNILILGLARQGLALCRYFVAAGANVTVSDAAPAQKLGAELAALNGLPVSLALGGHPLSLLDGCDLLCLSGGVPPQLPIVQEAVRRGIRLSNDSLLTLQLAPCPVIGITGSSGKTTTTTLVGAMLRRTFVDGGRTVHIGGNIGTPLLDRLDEVGENDLIVLELSSFQLEIFDPAIAYGTLAGKGPDVAAILNITPNHLDRHPSMTAYADAKFNLLRYLSPESSVILSGDDGVTQRLGDAIPAEIRSRIPKEWGLDELLTSQREGLAALPLSPVFFSRQTPLTAGAWLEDDQLICAGEPICSRGEVRLRGDHNISNLLAAAAISHAAGASHQAMRSVATSFTGVPHRLEEVSRLGGVMWINDSIATAPERAIAGLRVFAPGEQTLVLLAGGKDKNLPWDDFAEETLRRVNFLIGFGQAGPMIVQKVRDWAAFRRVTPPESAIVTRLEEAVRLAAHMARPGTVVLLSPGGTSYDGYKNFEERGEHFRRLVAEMQLQPI